MAEILASEAHRTRLEALQDNTRAAIAEAQQRAKALSRSRVAEASSNGIGKFASPPDIVNSFKEAISALLKSYDAKNFVEEAYAVGAGLRAVSQGPIERARQDFNAITSAAEESVCHKYFCDNPFLVYRIDFAALEPPPVWSKWWAWLSGPAATSLTQSGAPKCHDYFTSHSGDNRIVALHDSARQMQLCWKEQHAEFSAPGSQPWPDEIPLSMLRAMGTEINETLKMFYDLMWPLVTEDLKAAADEIFNESGMDVIVWVNAQPFSSREKFERQLQKYGVAYAEHISPAMRTGWLIEQCTLGRVLEILAPGPRTVYVPARVKSDTGVRKKIEMVFAEGQSAK